MSDSVFLEFSVTDIWKKKTSVKDDEDNTDNKNLSECLTTCVVKELS